MFRPVRFLLLLAVLFLPGQLCAAPGELGDSNGDNDNPHNLSYRLSYSGPRSAAPASGGTTEICVFCHTPHGATPKSTLWNRPDPANMGSFPIYNSVPLDGSGVFAIAEAGIVATTKYGTHNPPTDEYPNGATKLCLSCHDGVTSIGVLATGQVVTMESGDETITRNTMFWNPLDPADGEDFSKSHPVSFVYTQAVVDYINNSTTKIDVYSVPTNSNRAKLDGQFRMQCTTCHEPHFNTRGQGHTYPFWRNNDGTTNDTLDYENTCNQCHIPRTTFPHAL